MFSLRAKIRRKENVFITAQDAQGNAVSLFQWNGLGRLLAKHNIQTYIPYITGKYTEKLDVSNLITNAGLAALAARAYSDGVEAAFTYMAIGIGTTAAAVTDTALQSEITTNGGQRGALTGSRTTTDVTNDTTVFSKTWTFTGAFAVTEAGILNASSGGTLLARTVFGAINVTSGFILTLNWLVDND